MTGFLFLSTGGDVTFTVGIDDAFDLIINGQSVGRFIDFTDYREFQIVGHEIPSGFVPITLNFGDAGSEANVVLAAEGRGLPGGVIPADFLFHKVPAVP